MCVYIMPAPSNDNKSIFTGGYYINIAPGERTTPITQERYFCGHESQKLLRRDENLKVNRFQDPPTVDVFQHIIYTH